MNTTNLKRIRAQERIAELKKFYKNIGNLLFFILFLGTINYLTNGLDSPWFVGIIGLMCIGLGIDAIRTFIRPLIFKNWEQRKIESLLQDDTF